MCGLRRSLRARPRGSCLRSAGADGPAAADAMARLGAQVQGLGGGGELACEMISKGPAKPAAVVGHRVHCLDVWILRRCGGQFTRSGPACLEQG